MKSLKRIHKTMCLYKHVLCILFKLFIYTCLMHSLQTLHINISYVFSWNSSNIHDRTCLYEELEENTYYMFIWKAWGEYIKHVYMKRLKGIHRTCVYEEFINMSYVFSSNSSYTHVLCILFKLFIYTCVMYSLQTLHINMSYAFFSNSSYKHVLCI
jgi:multidrug transporter EmrE-like cation transporter